jgi:predicted phage replisome organizer
LSKVKKYYWLKLKEDFFRQKEIKKLRKIAGGDTYTIIYLKMLLLALKNDNKLYFEGVEDDFAEELALELDEDEENVSMTLAFLNRQNLIEMISEDEYLLPQCENMTGIESSSAERVRRHRLKKKEEEQLLQSNTLPLHCNNDETDSNKNVTTEIELEKEKEIELEIDIDNVSKDTSVNKFTPIIEKWNSLNLQQLRTISNNRQTLLNARIKEHGFDSVLEAIENINDSSFLKGQNNRNWMITFDWLVKPNNFVKVLENSYKDNTNDTKKPINNNEKSKKTKFHNFNETFTQYSSEEMDEIIRKSQREKFK